MGWEDDLQWKIYYIARAKIGSTDEANVSLKGRM